MFLCTLFTLITSNNNLGCFQIIQGLNYIVEIVQVYEISSQNGI